MTATKKINSRSKGATFERAIATRLRAWLGPEWTVARNPTDWQKGQVDGHGGEFSIKGPVRFPWAIECKAHESFSYGQLWLDTGPFWGFWKQAVDQAAIVDRKPLLILKRNNGAILVASWSGDMPVQEGHSMVLHTMEWPRDGGDRGRYVEVVPLDAFLATPPPR